MGMIVLQVEQAVDGRAQAQYGSEPRWLDHMRSRAARELAEKTLERAAVYSRVDPTEEELKKNPAAPVRHRWKIGIERDMSEIEARNRQMDEARCQGLREAAQHLRTLAVAYRNPRVDGHCKWVLASSMDGAARDLDKLADSVDNERSNAAIAAIDNAIDHICRGKPEG